jgi:hypothetical protein
LKQQKQGSRSRSHSRDKANPDGEAIEPKPTDKNADGRQRLEEEE